MSDRAASIVIAISVAAWLTLFVLLAYTTPKGCKSVKQEAMVSARSFQLCTESLVGCSLTYEQVRAVVAEADKAERCQ